MAVAHTPTTTAAIMQQPAEASGSCDNVETSFVPICMDPLPPEVEAFQQQKLAETLELMDELRPGSAQQRSSRSRLVISVDSVREEYAAPLTCEWTLEFYDTWYCDMHVQFRALPIGLHGLLAALHEADLVKVPRFRHLPHMEAVEVLHHVAANDLVMRLLISPWGPFPGNDSIQNPIFFASSSGTAAFISNHSPPEDATHQRGLPLPPVMRRRKRNVMLGAGMMLRHSAATGPHGAYVDGEICMRNILPVPSWLIPSWLIRLAAPILIAKAHKHNGRLGTFLATGREHAGQHSQQQEESGGWVERIQADVHGFYASAYRMGLVTPPEWLRWRKDDPMAA